MRVSLICRMKFRVNYKEKNKEKNQIEIRVEIVTPNRNLIKNHPSEQFIRRKDKGVMIRNKVQEVLEFIRINERGWGELVI